MMLKCMKQLVMGSSPAAIGVGHLISLIIGLFGGHSLTGGPDLHRLVDQATTQAAEASIDRCAAICASKVPECESAGLTLNLGVRLAVTFGLGWLTTLVCLGLWCCRKGNSASDTPSELADLSPTSLAERRTLVQAQLAEVRARRNGPGR